MTDFKDYGSGALFTNKKENDKQPDYQGPLTVEGRKYRMVAWTGVDKFGKTFLSVKVNEWQEPQEKTGSSSAPPPGDDLDSDIPF